jgi:hypothetical protein
MKKVHSSKFLRNFFILFLLGVIQFFSVLIKYETIESAKVFEWVGFYVFPIITVICFIFRKKLTYQIFYSYNLKSSEGLSKISKIKNTLAAFGLFILTFSFISYDTIIQTNDWFGQNKYQHVQTEILEVEYQRTKNKSTWTITIEVNSELIELTTKTAYYKGGTYKKTLNMGGAWGIIYAE